MALITLAAGVSADLRGQQGNASAPLAIVGTVENVSPDRIQIISNGQRLSLFADDQTEVWRGRTYHDFSRLKAGDQIVARYRMDAGRFMVISMWANISTFSGVITKVGEGRFDVLTNPNADPRSGYKKENKTVSFGSGTVFESSRKQDLRVGRGVLVTGLDLGNGKVQATRVTIYEGNRPAGM